MNILIITTNFPPDTAIAAVRPFMFAKYLRAAGHQVTVLRSGEIFNRADRMQDYTQLGIRVFSFFGEDCDAERYIRGEELVNKSYGQRKLAMLPEAIRTPMAWVYRRVDFFRRLLEAQKRFELQKAWIDAHRHEQFDVIFATYSNLENVYAGKYASEVFGCRWILDLRDPIAQKSRDKLWEYPILNQIQKKAILSASICTAVSVDMAEKIAEDVEKEIIALYNGFEGTEIKKTAARDDNILRFAYTGVMYEKRSSAATLFQVLRQLADAGKVDLNKVRIDYAGPHFEVFFAQAKAYGVEEILVDHGYVRRDNAYEIQNQSDIFLVLSWNTACERGVMTGKFYEGIRARKPILSLVSGEVPNSELCRLNERYHYGYCYEECRKEEMLDSLRNWVEESYQAKQAGKAVAYSPDPCLFTDFCYEKLTKQLETHMLDLQKQDGKKKCYFIHEVSAQKGKHYVGVQKKIIEQISVLAEKMDTEQVIFEIRGNERISKILKRIPFGPSGFCWNEVFQQIKNPDILYIRKPLCDRGFDAFLKKIKRKYPKLKILLEFPTYPYDGELFASVLNLTMYPTEVYYRSRLKRYIDRTVTFSQDREIFGIPAISIQNGVNLEECPVRKVKTETEEIHLLAVASFQKYHGYERAIQGLAEYYRAGGTRKIILDMVGGGAEVDFYKKLAADLFVQNNVVFWGPQHGEELSQRFNEADIGLGSFGFYKIGLDLASSLKLREYLARGLPVIAGSKQDLFTEETFPYYLEFPNDDSAVDMNRVVCFYDRVYHTTDSYEAVIRNIRTYAEENVTWNKTFAPVVDYVADNL